MIKCAKFVFEEIPAKNHWVTFAQFGNLLEHHVTGHEDWVSCDVVDLDPEDTWQLSMDQSTSNTGIFIKNYNNTVAWMIEVSRGKKQDASEYIFNLEMFLHKIGEGCKFSHIIYETAIDTGSYRSSQVAFQLEGMVRQLARRYAEFNTAKIDCIENASWRSVIIQKGRFDHLNRKEQTAESIRHIYHWTWKYGPSIYKDQDIFEAIGVMMGWFINSFDPLGRPYVRGSGDSNRTVGGFILPTLTVETVVEMFKEKGLDSELRVANPSYSIYKNVTRAVEPFVTTCIEFRDKYSMLALCVECNMKWLDPEVMTVIVTDASKMDSRLKEITGGEFHFVV